GRTGEGYWPKPSIARDSDGALLAAHATLGRFRLRAAPHEGAQPELLFTDNETNVEQLFGTPNPQPWVKDAFHRRVVGGDTGAVNPAAVGTKAAAWYRLLVPARGSCTVGLRLLADGYGGGAPSGAAFDETFAARIAEADAFYRAITPPQLTAHERNAHPQACDALPCREQF